MHTSSAAPTSTGRFSQSVRRIAGEARSLELPLGFALAGLGWFYVLIVPPVRPGTTLTLVFVIVVSAAATLWRRAPLAGLAIAAPFAVILAAAGAVLPAVAGPGLLLGATADRSSARVRHRLIWSTVVAVLVATELIGDLDLPGNRADVQSLVLAGLLWSVAVYAGNEHRRRRENMQRLAGEAEALRSSLERERRLSAAEERIRLARDLHDAIGHAVNVIAIHAGAARVQLDHDHERSRHSLTTIEGTARTAAYELDHMVGALRGDDASPTAPPPSLDRLPELVREHRAAGLDVRVTIEGDDRRGGPAVETTAYRIAQEALTNASRHGAPGAVDLGVRREEAGIAIEVANDAGAHEAEATSGRGIVGMRERAALLGGSVQAAERDGRFVLRAYLPYRSAP